MAIGMSPDLFLGEDLLISKTPRAAEVLLLFCPKHCFTDLFPHQTLSTLRAGVM